MNPSPQQKVERWLVAFIEDAEALLERYDEHLETLARLEARTTQAPTAPSAPPTTGQTTPPPAPPVPPAPKGKDKPLPDLETLQARHSLILEKLGGLGAVGGADAWRAGARVAQGRMQKWLGAHRKVQPDDPDGLRPAMDARQIALQSGRLLVAPLPDLAARLEQLREHIAVQQAASDPRAALGNLADTDSDLKGARSETTRIREGMQGLEKRAGEPALFAALLGQTSSLLKQIDDGERSLAAATLHLQRAIQDRTIREELDDLGDNIQRDLSQLTGKADAASWQKERRQLDGRLQRWLAQNGKLNTPQDAAFYRETQLVLSRATPHLQALEGLEGRLSTLGAALQALASDHADVAAAQRLRVEADAILSEATVHRAALSKLSSSFTGPLLFQGLLGSLGALETQAQTLSLTADDAERDARRRALTARDEDAQRILLAQLLRDEQKRGIQAMQTTDQPAVWLQQRGRTEQALRSWLDDARDLATPPEGMSEVEAVIPLLNQAQSLVPDIQDIEQEFERRRTIDFARASADPKEILVLHAALERLSGALEPVVKSLTALQKRLQGVGAGWDPLTALLRRASDQQLSLADFADRLYRMRYDQESGDPDDKTTSQGGIIDLTPEEEDAADELVERRIKSWLEEENRARHLKGEEPLTRKDVSEELEDRFRRIARRMVQGRTSRYA